MWTGKQSFADLQQQGRWNVEFFGHSPLQETFSKYPLIEVGELVQERREMVEPQDQPSTTFNYLGLENVQTQTGDLVGETTKRGRDIRSRSKVFHSGDVLYGRLRPYLNKVYLAAGPVADGVCSGEFYVLIPDASKVEGVLLRALLSSSFVQSLVKARQVGAALPRLSLGDLLGLKVPLPSHEDQQQFVQFLEGESEYRKSLIVELARAPQSAIEALERGLVNGTAPSASQGERVL